MIYACQYWTKNFLTIKTILHNNWWKTWRNKELQSHRPDLNRHITTYEVAALPINATVADEGYTPSSPMMSSKACSSLPATYLVPAVIIPSVICGAVYAVIAATYQLENKSGCE